MREISVNRGFLLACVIAGGLAVPPSGVGTPIAAAVSGVLGVLGLHIWRWSRLPSSGMVTTGGGTPGASQAAAALASGLAVGLFLLAVLRLVIEPAVPAVGARIAAAGLLPLWRRAAIIYVAAVGEELIFRLLLLSLVAGVAARMFRSGDARSLPSASWLATTVAALAFSAVHLPSWTAVVPLTLGLTLGVLSLNFLGGMVFGAVFVRRGIIVATIVHAGADCAIQLIGPLTR